VRDEAMGDFQVVDWVIGQMNAPRPQPQFLACGLYSRICPGTSRRSIRSVSARFDHPAEVDGDDLDDVPPIGRKYAKPDGDHRARRRRRTVEAGRAGLSRLHTPLPDAQLGRLLDAYEKSPFSGRTR
jgi:hypothetical protein